MGTENVTDERRPACSHRSTRRSASCSPRRWPAAPRRSGPGTAASPRWSIGRGIGALFDDGEDGLERALLEATDPATPGACRARALELSTERCAAAYELLYEDLLTRKA